MRAEADYTPYMDNRAYLYDKTLRQQIKLESVTSGLEFNQEMLMPITNHLGEVIDYHPIDDTFLNGHAKVVRSLKEDLHATGEAGSELVEMVTMEIQREYYL